MRLVGAAYGLWLLLNFLSVFIRVMADVPRQQGCPYNRWRSILVECCTPLPFGYLHFADIVDAVLLTTLSLHLLTNRCHSLLPIWSAHASCRLVLWLPTSALGAWLMAITLVRRLTGRIPLALSLAYPIGTVPSALVNSYFFISILSWPILIYSPRSYEAGAFLSFGPAWTAYGLGQ